MICPHCKTSVSAIDDARARRLLAALTPDEPTNQPLDKDDLCAEASIPLGVFEDVKRHYRDHILPQSGLALVYDRGLNRYWLTPSWIDLTSPDLRAWEGGGIKRLYHEARHLRDGLAIGYQNIPTTKRKERLAVRDIHSTISHVVERVEIAMESAALTQ